MLPNTAGKALLGLLGAMGRPNHNLASIFLTSVFVFLPFVCIYTAYLLDVLYLTEIFKIFFHNFH